MIVVRVILAANSLISILFPTYAHVCGCVSSEHWGLCLEPAYSMALSGFHFGMQSRNFDSMMSATLNAFTVRDLSQEAGGRYPNILSVYREAADQAKDGMVFRMLSLTEQSPRYDKAQNIAAGEPTLCVHTCAGIMYIACALRGTSLAVLCNFFCALSFDLLCQFCVI